MEAKEFVKNIRRMCSFYEDCVDCPNRLSAYCRSNDTISDKDANEIVSVVEKWAKEHPSKTRQSKLLKLFPDSKIENGYLFCPQLVNQKHKPEGGCSCTKCVDCCREFWSEEVE